MSNNNINYAPKGIQHALFSDEVSKPFRDVYVRSFGLVSGVQLRLN